MILLISDGFGFAQLPDAASLERTEAVVHQMSEIARKTPGVAESLDWAATLAGLGVNDLNAEPELVHATLIAMLKTREDRARVTPEVTARLAGRAA